MTKRTTTKRFQPRTKLHLIYALLALVIGFSVHSCANIPEKGVKAAGNGLEQLAKEIETTVRDVGGLDAVSKPA